ncbi:MAG: DUF2167 domain-containing protein [Gammaproteobacteria bacterium]|nr:DUF2167 domain-containing protein [Gammaproteobacteria bacterium]
MKVSAGILVGIVLGSWLNFGWCQAPDDAAEAVLTEEQQQYIAQVQAIWDSVSPQTGDIKLPGAIATLSVPDTFYYLGPEDASKVLVDIWGNPPGGNTLGMLFPAQMTPFERDSWAVTISYDEDGYVSDEDADKIDYSELLAQMKSDAREANRERESMGYAPVELVGWAAEPRYDSASHKMYWAKDLTFGDADEHTLNYNIRVLGRKGVLVLNFIAGMEQKPEIESNLDTVLAMAEFDQGARYSDFDPSIDKVAAYGIGALVAGKLIAKTGLFAAAFLFLKKFGVIIVVAIGAMLKNLFSRKKASA